MAEMPDAGGGQRDEGHDRHDRRDYSVRVARQDERASAAGQSEAAPDKIANLLGLLSHRRSCQLIGLDETRRRAAAH